MTQFLLCVAIGALWRAGRLWAAARADRRVALAQHRERARALREQGYDVVPPWLITSPNDRLFTDAGEEARYSEYRRRRTLGEF